MLIFEKATCKTMQALVPAAPVLHSSSANNASAISNVLSISVLSEPVLNSSSATNASVLFMVDWQFTVFCREVGFVTIFFATLPKMYLFNKNGQFGQVLP